MIRLFERLKQLRRNTRGATAVEYAMIISVVALGSLAALNALSGRLTTLFNSILPAVK